MENNIVKISRIEYIDAIRGFAMILVVYYHIIHGIFVVNSEFNDICVKFRMPLFFFISGFLSYSQYLNSNKIKKRCFNRFFGQLTPTIVVCMIYISISGLGFHDVFFNPTKYGYWFTIAMFEVFIVYAITTCLLIFIKASNKTKLWVYLLLMMLSHLIISLLTRYDLDITKSEVWNLTSIGQGILYLKYFLFGVICKLYYTKFIDVVENQYMTALSVILFIALQFFNSAVIGVIQGFLGTFIIYALFHHFRNFFNSSTTIGRQLIMIGTNTLEIYLIHFILLYGLMGLRDYEFLLQLITNNSIIEILIVTSLSLILIILSLLIAKFFKISSVLYSLLFGFKIK